MKSLQIACQKDLLKQWLQRCHVLIAAHSVASTKYRIYHYILGILIIIISGSMTFPYVRKVSEYLSSVIVILASVYTFISFNDIAEKHRNASKRYGEIMRMLENQMSLEQCDPTLLKLIETQIDKVNSEAPSIPSRIFKHEDRNMKSDLAAMSTKLVSGITFHSSPVTPNDLTEEHYKLEAQYFGRYAYCPSTFKEFKILYENKMLILCEARLEGKIVGYSIFEKISNDLFHLKIVIVTESLRNQGIGKRLINISCERISSLGVKYISLFTAEEAVINSIFRANADPVGLSSDLIEQEKKALNSIEKYRDMPDGKYGTKRVIPMYYTLNDGKTLDATFKLYRI